MRHHGREPAPNTGLRPGEPQRRSVLVVDVTVDQFDFLMIVVHLKSGRAAGDQAIRDQQAQVIGAFIQDVVNAEPREDILLVGDFNMIPGQDASNFHFLGGRRASACMSCKASALRPSIPARPWLLEASLPAPRQRRVLPGRPDGESTGLLQSQPGDGPGTRLRLLHRSL